MAAVSPNTTVAVTAPTTTIDHVATVGGLVGHVDRRPWRPHGHARLGTLPTAIIRSSDWLATS